jgi:hypothetical protein
MAFGSKGPSWGEHPIGGSDWRSQILRPDFFRSTLPRMAIPHIHGFNLEGLSGASPKLPKNPSAGLQKKAMGIR